MMLDSLGPHAGYIIAAFVIAAFAIAVLTLATIIDYRRLQATAKSLEERGLMRRPQNAPKDQP